MLLFFFHAYLCILVTLHDSDLAEISVSNMNKFSNVFIYYIPQGISLQESNSFFHYDIIKIAKFCK